MNIRYKVDLTETERSTLVQITTKGKHAVRKITRAHILLMSDKRQYSDARIIDLLKVSSSTVYRTKRAFVEYGLDYALDVGYSLQTSLVISDVDGEPITPVAQRVVNSEGSYATYYATDEPQEIRNNLDELCKAIEHSEQQCFDKPLVHIVDREADSIGHIR
ncbi:helix-turn-helix domain-containing protein, partial [Facilibium subflavum]|uniref:helix-turn-helix domain-containing protein n=1 Tax=Facilibium subflavum TaxID=2219058 RepID=UPI0013C33144